MHDAAPDMAAPATPRTLVVVGHGMVGHKLVESLLDRDATRQGWQLVVVGEEPGGAYDRVHLSSLFDGAGIDDLALDHRAVAADPAVTVVSGDPAAAIDRAARTITTAAGRVFGYDRAVLATGSVPLVPAVPGCELAGCFTYRTAADVGAIQAWAARSRRAAVLGGGLLGLEAAGALRRAGLVVDVVELAPRLMPMQVDEAGGAVLRQRIEALGVTVHTGTSLGAVLGGGVVEAVELESGPASGGGGPASRRVSGPASGGGGPASRRVSGPRRRLAVDMVVFAAGIRPRDELARAAGLELGERGGIVVDERCRTSDPSISAIGECALAGGRVHGLVAPGYQMARVVADDLCGGDATFTVTAPATRLKLLGVDVASFGDAHATRPGATTVTYTDERQAVHKRLVVDADGRIAGAILVGDAADYDLLAQMADGALPTPEDAHTLLLPRRSGPWDSPGAAALPGSARLCSCEGVTKQQVCDAIAESVARTGGADLAVVRRATGAGRGCGGCLPQLAELVRTELTRAGVTVDNRLCEHFPYSRQQLFEIVRIEGIRSFGALLAARGQGRGCEICKPAVASILASVAGRYILDDDQAGLQDTNDHFLANLQRDGTYSVVPRVPGGEITPERLIAIGEVARDFSLYTKITGGQRVDLFGARVEQLPAIWRRLIDAGFESGHAYGKAVRTVKSCVGSTWCRFGVQDSTALAIDLELRYRGLRAPHKVKLAVSGCARECAEAQSKDVGVIATERGWNLYVGGNGGTRPRHADLLAEDLDRGTLVRTIDRFLMWYVRSADRLERTATWVARLDGGLDHLRSVVLDDALGVCAELDAAMAHHVSSYRCEWRSTLEDPERLARFRTFVNTDAADPDIVVVTERDQPRPAAAWERVELARSPA